MVNTDILIKLRKITLYAINLVSINILLIIWAIDIFAVIILSEKTSYFKNLYDTIAFSYTGQIALVLFSMISVIIPQVRKKIFSNNFKLFAFITIILMLSGGMLNLGNPQSFLIIYALLPINAPALLMVYASEKLRQDYE